MIEAKPNKLLLSLFRVYLNSILKKSFKGVYFLNDIPELNLDKALLLLPNHMSWWDGFFVDLLNRKCLNRNQYFMMLEEQLKKFMFFKKFGVYSINQNDKHDIEASLKYTAHILQENKNCVIMYPQGELLPFDKRPVMFKRGGLSFLLDHCEKQFQILSIACKIQYYTERKPEVIVNFGQLINSKIKGCLKKTETDFIKTIDELDKNSINRNFCKEILYGKF